jgi:hypothetical protein
MGVDHVWLEPLNDFPQRTPRPAISEQIDPTPHVGQLQPASGGAIRRCRRHAVDRR